MNADTVWEKLPERRLAEVMTEIITQMLGLEAEFRAQNQIMLQTMGIKSEFRHVGIVPGRATAFMFIVRVVRKPGLVGRNSERTTGRSSTNGWRRLKSVTSHVDITRTIGVAIAQVPGAKDASWLVEGLLVGFSRMTPSRWNSSRGRMSRGSRRHLWTRIIKRWEREERKRSL